MKIFNKLKVITRKIHNRLIINNSIKEKYLAQFNHDIIDNLVLFDSFHGNVIEQNIFQLLIELNLNYPDFKIVVAINNIQKQKEIFEYYNIKNVELIKYESQAYFKALSQAKYLFNDNTFKWYFVKKEAQIYINTWHGTPLKTIGKYMQDPVVFNNTQRNFILADYLFLNNDYTINEIIDSHDLKGIINDKIYLAPSARNSVFFKNNNKRVNVKKKVFYMPTWRGNVIDKDNDHNEVSKLLKYFDDNINNDIDFYVKLHPIVSDIDYTKYNNIKTLPSNCETYEFLADCDILITDYSSVIFDFINNNKEIILFCYDKEDYIKDRGLNFSIDDLSLLEINEVNELCQYLNSHSKDFIKNDYSYLIDKYSSQDNSNGAKQIIDFIFNNETSPYIKKHHIENNKKTIFLIFDNFKKAQYTDNFFKFIDKLDYDKNNYYLVFYSNNVYKKTRAYLKKYLNKVSLFPIVGMPLYSNKEKKLFNGYYKKGLNKEIIKNSILREVHRCYGYDLKVDHYLLFSSDRNEFIDQVVYFNNKVDLIFNKQFTSQLLTKKRKQQFNYQDVLNGPFSILTTLNDIEF
jgi:CDP-glycerol glycerophosphotransferase (TagB/SpsB family)